MSDTDPIEPFEDPLAPDFSDLQGEPEEPEDAETEHRREQDV